MKNKINHHYLPGADFVLPNEIAEMTYFKKIDYTRISEDATEGWGISLGYENPEGAVADIYEYTQDRIDLLME